MEKGHDIQVQAAPVPSPFPVDGANPGPRCGHTLTVIIGADGDLSKAKLVMFGTCHLARTPLCSRSFA